MSHFNLENDLNDLLRLDTPLSSSAPLPRWQKNALRTSNSSFNMSRTLTSTSICYSKTPSKTPKRTPGKPKKTPMKSKAPKTPNGGDRFIPNRSGTQFDLAHYKVTQENKSSDESSEPISANKAEFEKALSKTLLGCEVANTRIISYCAKAPPAPEGFQSELRVLYRHGNTPTSTRKVSRYIPQGPDRILDAPDVLNDYYLNLIDWSCTNLLAVCLANSLYIWNATNGSISLLLDMEADATLSSVAWMGDGAYIAVGTSTGEVQLWNVDQKKKTRVMGGHSGRVGAMSWNHYVLSSGSRSGSIHHHDVRVPNHLVGTLSGHSQEVCGLSWSPDGRYLASGANDNQLNIWPCVMNERFSVSSPLHTFNQHVSAVKALAWCPWQPSILASGGGTADRSIRLWNCNTGTCLSTTDTKSQVCSILWSAAYKELISGHGYTNNQLCLWKYPTMTKIAELTGHTARIINLAMSPDGTTVVSLGADETLRIWKCFMVDSKKSKNDAKSKENSENVIFRQSIR